MTPNAAASLPAVACFGELLLRLTPPHFQRLQSAEVWEVHVGGAEANVACALAQWGHPARMLSRLPDNDLALHIRRHLRQLGVDDHHIPTGGARVGLYFYESGAGARGGRVTYDRAHSAFCDWPKEETIPTAALDGIALLHTTGISPAVSEASAQVTSAVLAAARAAKVPISLDLNYRSTLWQYGKSPSEVMPALAQQARIVIADQTSAEVMLGVHVAPHAAPDQHYAALGKAIAAVCPLAEIVAFTHRAVQGAQEGSYQGYMWHVPTGQLVASQLHPLTGIVERIGTGDAFAAGLLHGWLTDPHDLARAVELAAAAGALKHTMPGDQLLASLSEVQALVRAAGQAGRIHR